MRTKLIWNILFNTFTINLKTTGKRQQRKEKYGLGAKDTQPVPRGCDPFLTHVGLTKPARDWDVITIQDGGLIHVFLFSC